MDTNTSSNMISDLFPGYCDCLPDLVRNDNDHETSNTMNNIFETRISNNMNNMNNMNNFHYPTTPTPSNQNDTPSSFIISTSTSSINEIIVNFAAIINSKYRVETTIQPKNCEVATNEIRQELEHKSEHKANSTQVIPQYIPESYKYCEITDYLTLPQTQAAKKFNMAASTFSKRWKEASHNRKWPWRYIRKIDKEIECILHNISNNDVISKEVEHRLIELSIQRQKQLTPVSIRIS